MWQDNSGSAVSAGSHDRLRQRGTLQYCHHTSEHQTHPLTLSLSHTHTTLSHTHTHTTLSHTHTQHYHTHTHTTHTHTTHTCSLVVSVRSRWQRGWHTRGVRSWGTQLATVSGSRPFSLDTLPLFSSAPSVSTSTHTHTCTHTLAPPHTHTHTH